MLKKREVVPNSNENIQGQSGTENRFVVLRPEEPH